MAGLRLQPRWSIGLWLLVGLLLMSSTWPRTGFASWYSEDDPGVGWLMASGEPFSSQQLTAAMWLVPFDSCVRVTNLRTHRHVAVRINDRGPHLRFVLRGRVIDLSRAAVLRLADPDEGLIPVNVTRLTGSC